ncbi:EAL domain-containing protein [Methylotenera sp.]|uniref:bifunctional diguanylate cyclase/phosphodiesterase n=1 Tax=Methylotenera sp. TaxID=2051956 RepID=UPI002489D8AC|nr:EAL domain-containing protein [Methylotenera sp.]MDI1298099.1 EAL domain-containing protein [Methylotenera sp.]
MAPSYKLKQLYRWSDLPLLIGISLAYALLAKIALGYFSTNGVVSMVWPSSGLALAALILGKKKYWPSVFIGALTGNIMQGSPIGISMVIAFGNTLEALSCFWILSHIQRFKPTLQQPHDFLWLSAAGALSSLVSAAIGLSTLFLNGIVTKSEVGHNFLNWWQGDILGILLVTPLILVWRQIPYDWVKRERITEAIIGFGLAFFAGQVIFLGWFHDIFGITARGYWVFLFVTWAAVRFGRHGALLLLVMTAIQMLLGMVLAVGGTTNNQVPVGLLNFWLYMLALTTVGILIALVIDRVKSTESLLLQKNMLFNKVSQRVPGVIYQFKLSPDGSSCFPYASEAIQDIYEVSPQQVKENATVAFSTIHQEDLDDVLASIQESARTLSLWQHEFRVVLPKQGIRWRRGESQPEKMSDGSILWHGFITDITERKQSDDRIKRLSMLYKAISEINLAIVRMEQQSELFPLVCRCAVEFGGMKIAWVGQLDTTGDLILPVASNGDSTKHLDNIKVSSRVDVLEGRSTTGTALRENRPIIINDFMTNPMTATWVSNAIAIGWASAAAFPIQRNGKKFAVLTVCHEYANAFDLEAIALLEDMSKDISFALDNFDREMQRKAGEESLRIAASVYDTSSEGIMITDANNAIIAINPAFTNITGYSLDEVIGKNPRMLSSGRHDVTFFNTMWHEINSTGQWRGEIWDRRKNDEIYPKRLMINTVYNEDGTVQRRIAMFTDITQKTEADQLIWKQANFDFLTGLPNRQMFHDRLNQEIKKSNRNNLQLALLFIDLDRFKEINDNFGHDMGDAMLKEASIRLKRCVRESDTLSRLGGDEFTVILGQLDDISIVERVAQDILNQMTEAFHLGNEIAYISASVGIAFYPDDATTNETLLTSADQAMYAAKQMGRNRYHYFTQAMQKSALNRMRLTNELRDAQDAGQLRLFYQPIIELANNSIHKAEALIRWQHPIRGQISPAEFIPIAEETGLINSIGEWVFHEAVKQSATWRVAYHPEFQISINKSPVQFRDDFSKYAPWPDQLKALDLSGQSIVVEITEGMLMDASDLINNKLLAFRDAGIQVALDDFGTGYSSLSYLKKFDIDYLKIDQSFTRNLSPTSADMALCEAIIVMAHKLGIKVIAEGVETVEQRDLLIAADCDYAQGFLFSRPVPADEFEKLLTKS